MFTKHDKTKTTELGHGRGDTRAPAPGLPGDGRETYTCVWGGGGAPQLSVSVTSPKTVLAFAHGLWPRLPPTTTTTTERLTTTLAYRRC